MSGHSIRTATRLFPTAIKTPTHFQNRTFGTRKLVPTQLQRAIYSGGRLDEELVHKFDPAYWYSAEVGQILKDTYKLVAKLGFVNASTVWLAKDITRWSWLPTRYVTLKISTSHGVDFTNTGHHTHETYISKQILSKNPTHAGLQFLQTAIDGFQLKGERGLHPVLVNEPMREPVSVFLNRLRETGEGKKCESEFVRTLVGFVLSGLDYLHNECGIVHRDISLSNILIPLESISLLTTLEKSESLYPFPMKTLENGYIVHMPHEDFGPVMPGKATGPPKVHDFGSAVKIAGKSTPHFYSCESRCGGDLTWV
ncbi:unnamed protein product [Rhizoctonia solani]|uniref:non-specific serine/threonine protein kinase n=1 Tax=Rhizoctonia solani TaxID=456999 RepID=A0A8H2XGC8_9AGAM|nr:unnamed protein product [Rhizoctonia solani]